MGGAGLPGLENWGMRAIAASQLAADLLQEALDGGGSDNITIIVGRTIRPEQD